MPASPKQPSPPPLRFTHAHQHTSLKALYPLCYPGNQLSSNLGCTKRADPATAEGARPEQQRHRSCSSPRLQEETFFQRAVTHRKDHLRKRGRPAGWQSCGGGLQELEALSGKEKPTAGERERWGREMREGSIPETFHHHLKQATQITLAGPSGVQQPGSSRVGERIPTFYVSRLHKDRQPPPPSAATCPLQKLCRIESGLKAIRLLDR